ncbi:hypothetical protein Nepgr_026672 [Nepenthes gracilis]|uniref:Uncharacterized protein n=1 Tax=Nepenthes gracilis TaxID=150966 RepID=A0AAD3T9E4_NEPGR|nr:hypothetical protein Nepgr_026672 [Nepenthes gracilis]
MAPSTSIVAILQQIQYQFAANQKLHQHQAQQEPPSLFISCYPPTSEKIGAPLAQAAYLNRVYSPMASSSIQQHSPTEAHETEPINIWTSARQKVAQDKAAAGSGFNILLEADEYPRRSGLHCQISTNNPPSTILIHFIQSTCQDKRGNSRRRSLPVEVLQLPCGWVDFFCSANAWLGLTTDAKRVFGLVSLVLYEVVNATFDVEPYLLLYSLFRLAWRWKAPDFLSPLAAMDSVLAACWPGSIPQRCRCLQQTAVAPVGSFFSLQLPCGFGGFSLLCGYMSRDATVAEGCWFGVQSLNAVDVDALADPIVVFLADGYAVLCTRV